MELIMTRRLRSRPQALRASLSAGCAALAIFAAIGVTTSARAGGFQGWGEVTQGNASIGIGIEDPITRIDVQSRSVVIDWTGYPPSEFPPSDSSNPFPSDGFSSLPTGPVDFLPSNARATFTGQGAAADGYTVLNRVFTTGPAEFNGTVQSFLANGDPGGNIWFYAPNGIVVGASARFNVGSLLLTTNDVSFNGDAADAISLRGTAGSVAKVDIRPGAQLNALSDNAYLALVAPRIVQAGTVRANGSIALVAAEQADIRINAGLLDIAVSLGTRDLNGIVHSGVTSSTATTNPRAISLVAIPKNQAMTMLLSGSIGYEAATQAIPDGSSIVLAAGNGTVGRGRMAIGNATFNAPVVASASDSITVAPTAQGRTDFGSSATLSAGKAVSLTAADGTSIAAGRLVARANGGNGAGGSVTLEADGGLLDFQSVSLGAAGETIGGTIRVALDGRQQSWSDLALDASATGPFNPGDPNAGTAGAITLAIGDDAGLALTGDFSARSTGLVPGLGVGFRLDGEPSALTAAGTATIATVGNAAFSGGLDAGGGAVIDARLGITMSRLNSGGPTELTALEGPITISDDLQSAGQVTAQGTSISLASGGSLDLGDILAGGALNLVASGPISVDGAVLGETIAVRSADIAIGDNGRLGQRGTTRTIALTAIGDEAAIGDGVDAGFHLDATEASRLFADEAISISAQPAASPLLAMRALALAAADPSAPVLRVGDLEMAFGNASNLGAGGTLQLTSAGSVEVAGAFRLVTASAADHLAIDAGQITVTAGTGGIAMRDAGGALQGQLGLTGDSIIAADAATLAELYATNDPAVLDRPTSPPDASGSLQAGEIAISVDDALLIQNTGQGLAYDSRRGFSANSVAITTRLPDALIVINGQTFDEQGVARHGLDAASAVFINDVPATDLAMLDPRSSFNGCLGGTDCQSSSVGINLPSTQITQPGNFTRALDLARGVDGNETLGRSDGISALARNDTLEPEDSLDTTKLDGLLVNSDVALLPYLMFFDQPDPARQQPLLDQPVTGVGNDDLWQAPCSAGSSGCAPAGDSSAE
jgi:filamentous hemagglutinin family protein